MCCYVGCLMLKEQAKLVAKIHIVADTCTIAVAFWMAYLLRGSLGGLAPFQHYAWLLLIVLPSWLLLLNHFGLYSSQRVSSNQQIFTDLVKVHLVGALLGAAAIYFFEPKGFSRGFFGSFIAILFLFLTAEHLLARFVLRYIRSRGYNFRTILLVGTRQTAETIIDLVEMHRSWGLRIVGLIQPDDGPDVHEVKGYLVLGRLADLETVCKKHQIDEVIFCSPREESTFDIASCIHLLETFGITSRTVLNLYYTLRSKVELQMFHDRIPLMTFMPVALSEEQLFLKRCIDVAGGLAGMSVTLLLTPFIALAIKLESPGPLLFSQVRVGQNGRRFHCWKFRSMYIDAEERKKELLHLNEMGGAIFKIKDDPRITRVGKFLRKTSLDELPQFWNVLCGEMSLVGTRPPTPDEVANYENWQRRRISIKPGITGLWQVSGRNSIKDFNEVVRLDLEYIDTWTLWQDFKLMFRTLKVVFLREGAQ